MFEEDYVMRIIKEIIRAILKMLFGIDTNSPSIEMLEDAKDRQTCEDLIYMIDAGDINAAENKIYDITDDLDRNNLKIAVLFYSYLNDKSDDFLEEHNFTREEVELGLKNMLSKYGVENFTEMF